MIWTDILYIQIWTGSKFRIINGHLINCMMMVHVEFQYAIQRNRIYYGWSQVEVQASWRQYDTAPHTRFLLVHWKYGSRRGDSTGYIKPVHWCCRTTNDLVARKSQGYAICTVHAPGIEELKHIPSMQA